VLKRVLYSNEGHSRATHKGLTLKKGKILKLLEM
jgi:hypothetical protein